MEQLPDKARFDEDFLARVRAGDQEATTELLEAHRRTLLWRLQNLHGVPHQDAEDVLQTVYERLLVQRPRLREGVSGYLMAIAENAAIDYHRKRVAEVRAIAEFIREKDHRGGSDAVAARIDVRRLLPQLTERCYKLLRRVLLEERTHAEYAEETKTPRGTVGTTIARCLTLARDLLRRPRQ